MGVTRKRGSFTIWFAGAKVFAWGNVSSAGIDYKRGESSREYSQEGKTRAA